MCDVPCHGTLGTAAVPRQQSIIDTFDKTQRSKLILKLGAVQYGKRYDTRCIIIMYILLLLLLLLLLHVSVTTHLQYHLHKPCADKADERNIILYPDTCIEPGAMVVQPHHGLGALRAVALLASGLGEANHWYIDVPIVLSSIDGLYCVVGG
jgi:hypothetical protein